jgi:ribosome maturation factor RimP
MSASLSVPHGIDRDALLRVVEPVVRAHGAELVDLELKPDRGGWVLRVSVEKAGSADNRLSTREAAVDLELCADVSRDLSPALDVVDLIPHAYHLEVGSPGVERPLRASTTSPASPGRKPSSSCTSPSEGSASSSA